VQSSSSLFRLIIQTKLKKKICQRRTSLLDPKWKDQLGIEAGDTGWFAAVAKGMGKDAGLQYFKDLKATNGLAVRKGHSLLTELVSTGEVPMALTVYNYKTEQLKQKGASLDWFAIEPALTIPGAIGVTNQAKNPNAAVLFYDFMLSDGQQKMYISIGR
jgi:iron(III) transport system substrate-binding protein